MRFGFLTGSITRIGSGRTEVVPLAHALSKLGCTVYGLEATRFKSRRRIIENLEVHLEPIAPYLAHRFLSVARAFLQHSRGRERPTEPNGMRPVELAAGDGLLDLANRLNVDVIYAFHNTNVARVLKAWPHPSRLLIINLIGFGIDPSRGGAADTFPLQKRIFEHPYWDLHITATKFEFEQYCQVYEQLGIDPRKLMYLPHSYDEELFRLARAPSVERQPASDPITKTLLYPVNVYPRKNIELAIDVLSIVNRNVDCKLIVTGKVWDQAYYARLLQRAQLQDVGDRVSFLGGVTRERMLQLYAQADATVYTSHQETFGLGIVESLGCGTPAVGPGWILPCREILGDALGGWAAPKDPRGFAAIILESFQANDEPARIAASAQVRYGNRAIAARFLEKCCELKSEKNKQQTTLESINWKELYQDAGNLL